MNREHDDLRALRTSLIRSARSDTPPPRAKTRTLLALGLASAGTGLAESAAAGTVAKLVGLKWFVGGVLIGASALGTFELTQSEEPAKRSSPPAVIASATSTPARPSVSEEHDAGQDASDDATAAKRPATVVQSPRPSRSAGLAREVALLDEARSAIQRGKADEGLDALEKYGEECGDAQLGHEATALRVQALQQSGRCEEAAVAGESFLRGHPSSPVAKRIRSLLSTCR